MRIDRWDGTDQDMVSACYEVFRAAHLTDDPFEPPRSAGTFCTRLMEGPDKNPGELWVVPGAETGGAAVAYYWLGLPDLENRDRADVALVVHPAARRRGIGRALLRHAAARAADNARSVLDGEVVGDSAGDAFARHIGARLALEEVRRVQDLRKIPPGLVADLRQNAERAAAGYSLVTWTGPVPDEYCGRVAEVFNAFNDAPRGAGMQDEVWDADRVRERTGSVLRAGHLRGYTVAVMHDATGEMAGFTAIVVDPGHPEWAYQMLTAVTRPHRGHRLGLLVKTAMLEWLAEAEPKLERIATGNAAANEHMIAVNETLGYEVIKPGFRYYEIGVSSVIKA